MVVHYEVIEASEVLAEHVCAPPYAMVADGAEQIICQCLQVTESTVREAAARCPFFSLAEIGRETGAGTGCTACHRRLRRLLG